MGKTKTKAKTERKTKKITVITVTEYEVEEMTAENITSACEYWADNGSGEEDEYGYHLDTPFDTLDHFMGYPETSTLTIEGGKAYVFKSTT